MAITSSMWSIALSNPSKIWMRSSAFFRSNYFTGLPLDIRHVAFSSANIGYAAVSANLSWDIFIQSVVFVLLIGIVNLVVSFSLTLWIALRSLGAEVESWSNIIKCVWRIIKKRPLSLFFPLQLDDK